LVLDETEDNGASGVGLGSDGAELSAGTAVPPISEDGKGDGSGIGFDIPGSSGGTESPAGAMMSDEGSALSSSSAEIGAA
jgi:hypothetical protein